MNSSIDNHKDESIDWSEMFQLWLTRAQILFRNYWYIILLGVSLGMALQAFRQVGRKPLYVSYAQMTISGHMSLPEKAVYREELSNFFGTQIRLMESLRVCHRARERVSALRPDLKPVFVDLQIKQLPETSVFLLEAKSEDPVYSQLYLEAVMQEYLNFKRERRSKTAENTFLSIMEKALQYQEQIEKLEKEKFDFQKKNNIVFLQEQGSNAGSYLAKLNNKLAEYQTKASMLNSVDFKKILEEESSDWDPSLVLPELTETNEQYVETIESLQRLKAEKDEFSIYMKPKHPKIMALSQSIQRQENLLKVLRRSLVRQLKGKEHALEVEIGNLQTEIVQWKEKALEYSRLLAEFEQLNSKLDRLKNTHEQLLNATQSIDLNINLDQEMVSILEEASVAQPIVISVFKEIAKGASVGLFLGVGILLFIGLIDPRLISTEDIQRYFDLPVLGMLPFQKSTKKGSPLIQPENRRCSFAEACRTIRSSLLYAVKKEGSQSIMITSTIPGEGKSTLTSNLAIALGLGYSKTLLVDLDFRRGCLHKILTLNNEKGIVDLLQEEASFEEVIQHSHYENVDFIACGPCPDQPGELLMDKRLKNLLQELKTKYDYVLFDAPPVLATDDTSSFSSLVDLTVFVVRSGFTRIRQAKTALENLKMRGGKIQGIVLNFTSKIGQSYHYFNYYNDYSQSKKD